MTILMFFIGLLIGLYTNKYAERKGYWRGFNYVKDQTQFLNVKFTVESNGHILSSTVKTCPLCIKSLRSSTWIVTSDDLPDKKEKE